MSSNSSKTAKKPSSSTRSNGEEGKKASSKAKGKGEEARKAFKSFTLEDSAVLGPQKINMRKYRSAKSGLTVYLADNVMGPLVNGYFALATEAQDDAGLPHTLEHLVFMGSEKHPYKGVLDSIANRCLAQGTNAWTATDHTCYTISCVGLQGFLNLLPVYMDHVLNPLLTPSSFHTEVYHLNGSGEDAGVVYCEMQAIENRSSTLVDRALSQTLFAAPSGYRYETGGILKDLRTLTNERVKAYHAAFYRPENMAIIITGMFADKYEAIFDALDAIEQDILAKAPRPPITRPWQSPLPSFTESVAHTIKYPAEKDAPCAVSVAWRGPAVSDHFTRVALAVLWEYLTESSVSPLQKALIYTDEPYCTDLNVECADYSEAVWTLGCSNVPLEKAKEVEALVLNELRRVRDKGISKTRMANIIAHLKLSFTSDLEQDASEMLAEGAICNFLYSKSKDLAALLDENAHLDALNVKPDHFWIGLLNTWVLEKPRCSVVALPDAQLSVDMAAQDKARVESRQKALGKTGLKSLKKELDTAKAANEVAVPPELISKFKVPDVAHIKLIPVSTIRNGEAVSDDETSKKVLEVLNKNDANLPFFIQFDHLQTAFAYIRVYMDTSDLDENMRKWLELYFEIIFEVPVTRNGERWGHQKVVDLWNEITVDYSSQIGFNGDSNFSCGSYPQLLVINISCEVGKYKQVIDLLRDTLMSSVFDKKRVKQGITRLLKSVKKKKQDASKILNALVNEAVFDQASNLNAVQVFRQNQFLKATLELIGSDPDKVSKGLGKLVRTLFTPKSLRVQVSANILDNAVEWKAPWTTFCPSKTPQVNLDGPKFSSALRHKDAFTQKPAIVGLAAIESSFLLQAIPGPKFRDADVGALSVLMEYLTTMEGPFWREIRGRGLSYGYDMWASLEKGVIFFQLQKSTSVCEAFAAAKDIAKQSLESAFDADAVEGAKSAVIYSLVSEVGTVPLAADNAFLTFLSKMPVEETIKSVLAVTPADLSRVLKSHLIDLFDASKALTAVAVNPAKLAEVQQQFKAQGVALSEIADVEEFLVKGSA